MIKVCIHCSAKNRVPDHPHPDRLGQPVCARCGKYLFPHNFESETISSSTGEIGYIYILARKSGKIVKVGETSRDPSKRQKEYVAEYKLVGFDLFREFKVPLNARKDIEKLAHQKLQHLRLSLLEKGGAREIFECDTATAVKAIEEAKTESKVNRIELEKQRLQQLKKDKLAKEKAKYDQAFQLFEQKLEVAWKSSDLSKKLQQDLDELLKPLDNNYLLFSLLSWGGVVLMAIPFLFDFFKNGFSGDHLVFYVCLGIALWFHLKHKEYDNKYSGWINKKNALEVELNKAKKRFVEPQVQEYKRLNPARYEQ